MMGLKMRVREGLGRWFGGLGSWFGAKGRELSGREMPAARDDAEEALWQAMGWADPEDEDALATARHAAKEVLS